MLLGVAALVLAGYSGAAAGRAPLASPSPETATPVAVQSEATMPGTTLTTDAALRDQAYVSETEGENALRVQNAIVTLNRVTVAKKQEATQTDASANSANAALLATQGSRLTIRKATVTSASAGGAGVCSEGSGTQVQLADSVITTTAPSANGLWATQAGALQADDLTVTTAGDYAAALSATDGGSLQVSGGAYTAGGYHAPALYAAADVTASGAELTANNAEALIVDGGRTVTLEDCAVSGNPAESTQDTDGAVPSSGTVLICRTDDPTVTETASLMLDGGELCGANGDLFAVAGTQCDLVLRNVAMENAGGALLRAVSTARQTGVSGAQVVVTAEDQQLEGTIVVDDQSALTLHLTAGSELTGTVQILQTAPSEPVASDTAIVTIDADSRWVLTGDCVISALHSEGEIEYNGYTITLADGTVLRAPD